MIFFALALGASAAANGQIGLDFPPEFKGYWHKASAPCGVYQDGFLLITRGGMSIDDESTDDDFDIRFGVRRVNILNPGDISVKGVWHQNTVFSIENVRFTLSKNGNSLTLKLNDWHQLYYRCPRNTVGKG